MNIDNLVKNFPSHDKFKGLDIREMLTTAFQQCKFYQEVSKRIYDKLSELWPYPNASYDSTEYQEYRMYFYNQDNFFCFQNWIGWVLDEFIRIRDWKRSYKDACEIASDQWCNMIFKGRVQNNGDQSTNGGLVCALATLGKFKANEGISEDVIGRFKRLMTEYYVGGCLHKWEHGTYEELPDCDYNPNKPLRKMLLEAGVSEKKIDLICPWKTTVYIDKRDNSVVVQGYQRESYF